VSCQEKTLFFAKILTASIYLFNINIILRGGYKMDKDETVIKDTSWHWQMQPVMG